MEVMSKTKKTETVVGKNEDWGVLPFDEAEDMTRWDKLIKETEDLEREVARHEAVHGKILMEEPLSEIQPENQHIDKDDLF